MNLIALGTLNKAEENLTKQADGVYRTVLLYDLVLW